MYPSVHCSTIYNSWDMEGTWMYTHIWMDEKITVPICKIILGFPGGSDSKASAYRVGDLGSIPGLGRSPGEGNGNPLQYSCLKDSMDWILLSCKKERIWVHSSELDEPRFCYTEWSELEREKHIINVYIWNVEKWYWWTSLQGRNRHRHREQTYGQSEGRRRGQIERVALKHIHYICKTDT